MPRLIAPGDGPAIGLEELVDTLAAHPIDHRDEDAFAAQGPLLARLARNRDFLARIAIRELEARCADQVRDNLYGPPVLMLAAGRGDWFVRANIWPAAHDSVMTASGPKPFFYGVPHDHGFGFLTVGYHGPGYVSDYWEYDHASVAGYAGEPVALTPCGRHRLGPGQVMLYRAHRDVHEQHPPEALSVTINIMENGPRQPWLDQYRFDTRAGTIAGLLNPLASATLLPLVAGLAGAEGAALLMETARRHPSERMRIAAIAAAAGAAQDLAGRIATWEAGAASPAAQVAGACRTRLAALLRHRAWTGMPAETDTDRHARPDRAA